jgi:tyrosyl-tRNA synthetase
LQPADIETVRYPPDAGLSLPKILVGTGLAGSRTDAERKIKEGAVQIDGIKFMDFSLPEKKVIVVSLGKKYKRIEP